MVQVLKACNSADVLLGTPWHLFVDLMSSTIPTSSLPARISVVFESSKSVISYSSVYLVIRRAILVWCRVHMHLMKFLGA